MTTEAAATVDLFRSWGIAIFPGPRREKGTRVQGWPNIDVEEAARLTLRELDQRAVNIVARTGPNLGAIDLDGKNGELPDDALRRLLTLLPEGCPVVRTARGFHVLFRPARPLGDGPLPSFGAEIFTGGHLINLPPSLHPSGRLYTWERPPGAVLPEVDLEAVGLLPQETRGNGGQRVRRQGAPEPAPPERRLEFEGLMARLGIYPHRGGEELYRCPWHEDTRPSLGVNWDGALFYCHACNVGGGLVALRRLLGEPEAPYLEPGGNGDTPRLATSRGTVSKSGVSTREAPERLRRRLSAGLARLEAAGIDGLPAIRNRQPWAEAVAGCHQTFRVFRCLSCGAYPAFPVSCGFPLCPVCAPGRLAADWRRHEERLPDRMTLFRLEPLRPAAGSGAVRRLRNRFNEWRKAHGPKAGVYGVRASIVGGVVTADLLLAVPDAEAGNIEGAGTFKVEALAKGQTPTETLGWLTACYLEEAASWHAIEDLAALLAEARGRRRFQGFGGCYGRPPEGESESAARLSRVAGGACKGGRQEPLRCPACGSAELVAMGTVDRPGVRAVDGGWLWDGPREPARAPPVRQPALAARAVAAV